MIQDSVDSDASRLVRMVGSATFTTVVSSRAMNIPASSTTSACQERRGTAKGRGPPAGPTAAACPVWSELVSVMAVVLGVGRGGGKGVGRQRPCPFVRDDGGGGGQQLLVPADLGAEPVLAVLEGVPLGHREVGSRPVVRQLGLGEQGLQGPQPLGDRVGQLVQPVRVGAAQREVER